MSPEGQAARGVSNDKSGANETQGNESGTLQQTQDEIKKQQQAFEDTVVNIKINQDLETSLDGQ